MADGTQIGWTDASWPIVAGCEHLSPGCDNCWSAKLTSTRLKHQPAYAGLAVDGRFTGEVRILPERLGWSLKWRKPRRVFVCSASDLFHKGVPTEFIAKAFAVMALAPQHTFQVLTKRAGRMRSLLNSPAFRIAVLDAAHLAVNGEIDHVQVPTPALSNYLANAHTALRGLRDSALTWPLPNVHLGVSAEDQHWFDIRYRALEDTPAAVRWVSAEPLLGPLSPTPDDHTGHERDYNGDYGYTCLGCSTEHEHVPWYQQDAPPGLGWVVVGGESGPNYRPMEIAWLTRMVDHCRRAGIPVYVKQDSGLRAGQQGRIPDAYWVHEYPQEVSHA